MPFLPFILLRRAMEENRSRDGSTPSGGRGLVLFFVLTLLGLAGVIGALEWWAAHPAK